MQTEEEIDEEIEEAVLAERAECARIVRTFAKPPAWITAEVAEGIALAIMDRRDECGNPADDDGKIHIMNRWTGKPL